MVFDNRRKVVYGAWRPRLSIGTKTLLAFFALIFLLSGSFYYFSTVKLAERIEKEALNDLNLKLKGAWKIYYSRIEQMKLGMLQAANQGAIKAAVEAKDAGLLSGLLSDFKTARPYVDLWAVVDGSGRVIASTSKDMAGQRLEVNGLVSKAIRASEPVSSTEEISIDTISSLDNRLSSRLNDTMALMQVVVTPVISKAGGAVASGAFVTGILLNRNSWLTNTIYDTFQVSSAIVDIGVHDSVALASWGGAKDVFGPAASVPEDVASSIKAGDRFSGPSVSRGIEAYFAAEPIMNSEGGVIGAIAIGVPDAEVKRHIKATETDILILACLGALLGMALAYFVYIDTTRPIRAVTNAMKGMADGDLDARLDLRTKDDFEAIGNGFNVMAEKIRIRELRLESFNKISMLLLMAKNPDELIKAAVEKLTHLTGAAVSVAYLFDEETGIIKEAAGFGALEGLGNIGQATEGALRCVYEKKVMIQHNEDAVKGNSTTPGRCQADAWFPLLAKGEPIGAIMLGGIDLPDSAEADHLASIVAQISLSLDNATTHSKMERLSVTDPLTSLYNRRHFFDSMGKDFELSRRYATPIAVIMIDIDNFKTVNDTYGHQQGDIVLSELSSLLRAHTRSTDLWARYGGEEFIGYVTHTEADGVRTLAEKLKRAVESHRFTGLEGKKITASFGVAYCPYDVVKDTEELIKISDERLYIAKKSGKNRVVFINEPAYEADLEQAVC